MTHPATSQPIATTVFSTALSPQPTPPSLSAFGVDASSIHMFSEWHVSTPVRQRSVLQALADIWARHPWPSDLHGYYVFASLDGSTLLHCSQWTGKGAFDQFVLSQRDAQIERVEAAAPGALRDGLGRFRLYRSYRASGVALHPGCIVIERAQANSLEAQQQWIDAICDALEGEKAAGLVAAYCFACADGRVVDVEEWSSEAAHFEAVENRERLAGTAHEPWNRVQAMPGITQRETQRFYLPIDIGSVARAKCQAIGGQHD